VEKYQNIVQFRQEMRKFFNEYRKKLHINPAWRITLDIRRSRNTWAEVEWDYSTHKFWVYINDKKNATPKELKDSIVHELIHITLMSYTHLAEEITQKLYAYKGADPKPLLKLLNQREEMIVTKITSIILGLDRHD